MERYFKIYRKLLKINFAALVIYRGNFVNSIISSTLWGALTLASILLLTYNQKTIYTWTKDELILLTISYSILIGIFHTLFSRNFERLSQLVYLGQLDSLLIKPIDTQFLVSVWLINYSSIIRTLAG